MEITTRLDGEEMHIALRGRLDAAWSGTVHKTLQDTIHGGCHRIALDLSQVDYLSSAGIRILVLLAKNLKAIGGTLRLSAVSPPVSDVLTLVGLYQLLEARPAATPAAATIEQPEAGAEARSWRFGECYFEVYDLSPQAVQQGLVIGAGSSDTPAIVRIGADTWAIGQGALGGSIEDIVRAGELLAVGGLALALPGDDPDHPDWLQQEGDWVPEIVMQHGLKAQGRFRHLLRFGVTPETPPLNLSVLLQAAMQLCAGDCIALVILGETVQLIGAALQTPLQRSGGDFFAFPALRDRLLFTAEPAYADETCLIAGVVARHPSEPLRTQLRPVANGSDLYMHLHAGIVPFSPVRKGFIELQDGLEKFIDSQTVRGLLHLLNDDRESVGAGESCLRRGALWCAPLTFTEATA